MKNFAICLGIWVILLSYLQCDTTFASPPRGLDQLLRKHFQKKKSFRGSPRGFDQLFRKHLQQKKSFRGCARAVPSYRWYRIQRQGLKTYRTTKKLHRVLRGKQCQTRGQHYIQQQLKSKNPKHRNMFLLALHNVCPHLGSSFTIRIAPDVVAFFSHKHWDPRTRSIDIMRCFASTHRKKVSRLWTPVALKALINQLHTPRTTTTVLQALRDQRSYLETKLPKLHLQLLRILRSNPYLWDDTIKFLEFWHPKGKHFTTFAPLLLKKLQQEKFEPTFTLRYIKKVSSALSLKFISQLLPVLIQRTTFGWESHRQRALALYKQLQKRLPQIPPSLLHQALALQYKRITTWAEFDNLDRIVQALVQRSNKLVEPAFRSIAQQCKQGKGFRQLSALILLRALSTSFRKRVKTLLPTLQRVLQSRYKPNIQGTIHLAAFKVYLAYSSYQPKAIASYLSSFVPHTPTTKIEPLFGENVFRARIVMLKLIAKLHPHLRQRRKRWVRFALKSFFLSDSSSYDNGKQESLRTEATRTLEVLLPNSTGQPPELSKLVLTLIKQDKNQASLGTLKHIPLLLQHKAITETFAVRMLGILINHSSSFHRSRAYRACREVAPLLTKPGLALRLLFNAMKEKSDLDKHRAMRCAAALYQRAKPADANETAVAVMFRFLENLIRSPYLCCE